MPANQLKAGDVLGFSGRSWESAFINVVTGGLPLWSLSHVGIVAPGPKSKLLVYESTDDNSCPCEITGKRTVGVQAHSIESVVRRYHGRVWRYPLYRSLYPYESCRLNKSLSSVIGRPYDWDGAKRTGGFIWSRITPLFWEEDFKQFFCSELVAANLAHVGIWPTSNASRWNPNHLVRELRRSGVIHKPVRLK